MTAPGATPEDWFQFSVMLDLTADLLPVVSNTNAKISETSSLKQLGKTPSLYNRERLAVGLAKWTERITTPSDVEQWQRQPDYGICLQTRSVRAIDIDIADADTVDTIIEHIAGVRCFAEPLPVRTRANSGKCLLAFRLEGEYRKRIIRTQTGIIEFLANGQQFIAAGTHPSGVRYEWTEGLPSDFPIIEPETFERVWKALEEAYAVAPSTQAKAPSDTKQVLSTAIKNDPLAMLFLDRDMVKRTEATGRMFVICPWESEHSTLPNEDSESASVYWPANTGGYDHGSYKCLHAHCDHRTVRDVYDAFEYHPPADGGFEVDPDAVAPVDKRDEWEQRRVYQAGDVPGADKMPWYIYGVLPKAEVGLVFGESGAGKSFWILDLLASMANQEQWNGKPIEENCRCLYVACEDLYGAVHRLKAYTSVSGVDMHELNIDIDLDGIDLLSGESTAKLVTYCVKAKKHYGLIVIDTLARATIGADENSSKDMGVALANCKRLHDHTGAMVLLVHHAGKDSSKGARGWSGLKGNQDVQIEIVRDGEYRAAIIDKLKNGQDKTRYDFRLATVVVGENADGSPITSCVVEHGKAHGPREAKAADSRGPKLRPAQQAALRAIEQATGLAGEMLSVKAAIDAILSVRVVTEQEKKAGRSRSECGRQLQALVDRGLLLIVGDQIALPEQVTGNM